MHVCVLGGGGGTVLWKLVVHNRKTTDYNKVKLELTLLLV